MGAETQKASRHADPSQKRFTNDDKARIASNYRKIKEIFCLTIEYRENFALMNEAIADRNGVLAGDLLRKGLRILEKIRRRAEAYDGQPHTIDEIEQDMHCAELRISSRKCFAFAAKLGITPLALLEIQMQGVLPC